ncbi:MAG: hypothetical protein K1X79_11515 [Oligoflexia bacterium]|nr:hypothetical protein [Oligoflexia bacterium]
MNTSLAKHEKNQLSLLSAKTRLGATRLLSSPLLHAALLIGLVVMLLFRALQTQREMAGSIGFAMDDAWIHVTVARNFAHGLSWGVVPGKMLSVSTSPTWTLLLSVFFVFFDNPLKITFLCSLLCMGVAVVSFYALVSSLTGRRSLGLLAGVLVALDPIALWGLASGLELPLALAALGAALWLYYLADASSALRRYAVPLALAFAAVSRPELFILIPLAIFDTFFTLRRSVLVADQRQAFRVAAVQCGVVFAALLPYFAFNMLSHGKIFPATYYAKTIVRGVGLSAALADGSWSALRQSLYIDPLVQVFQIVDVLQKHQLLVLLLMLPGVMAFARPFASKVAARGYLLPLALILLPWVMGMGSPSKYMSNHADRYFVIFPPLAICMACMTLKIILEQRALRAVGSTLMCLMILFPLRSFAPTMRHIGIDAESTQRLYVDMPIWLNENLDPKAKLAVNDIGGIGYYAPRDLIDVMGLASPEVWPAIQRGYGKPVPVQQLREFLRQRGIEYIILSPRYYPELTKDRSTFEPIREWSEKYEHGRTISPQVLYRINWH